MRQRVGRQIQQPRTHHAAIAPDFGNLVQIQRKIGLVLHQREAFRIGLHHSVFDAVVDHLGEVACTARANPSPALVRRRRERCQDRMQPRHRRFVATHHQAIAFLQTPDATAGAAIDKRDATGLQQCRTPLRILVVRIAAIDDDVAGLQQGQQLRQRVIDDLAGRHHQPHHARARQCGHQRCQRIGGDDALGLRAGARVRARIVAMHAMPTIDQALGHVGAHAAQSHHTQFHNRSS